MGLMSRLRSTLAAHELAAEQYELVQQWEYAQANDRVVLDADPFKDELPAATRLHDASPEVGFARLLGFANGGSVYSAIHVAWSYATGTGVHEDKGQARAWYRRAYEGGSDRGLLDYAAYLRATGHADEAETVYETGWQRGFAPAVYRLTRMRLRPTLPREERLAWKPVLEWAAGEGHPAARYLLTIYLLHGLFGLGGIPAGITRLFTDFAAIRRQDEDRPLVG